MGEREEEIQSLLRRLRTYRNNLRRLEEQKAKFGPLYVPTPLANEIDEVKKEIARIEYQLRQLGVKPPERRPNRVAVWQKMPLWALLLVLLSVVSILLSKTPDNLPEESAPSSALQWIVYPSKEELEFLSSLSIVAEGATPTPPRKSFQDDFSDRHSGWDCGEYVSGEYHMRSILGNIDIPYFLHENADFVLEVDVRYLRGSKEAGYGLVFRDSSAGYYAFLISKYGYYTLYKEIANLREELQPWTKSSSIRQLGEGNRLKITCSGPEIKAFANNKLLTKITDDYLKRGKAGLIVASGQSDDDVLVAFDDFNLQSSD